MIREMTLGQYYKTESILHRLDPRIKLMGTLVFAVSLFLPRSIAGMLAATLALGAVIQVSGVPFSFYFRGVKPLLPVIVFSAVINVFFTGGDALVRLGILTVSREGLVMAAFMILRLTYLIAGTSVMTFTTTPKQLMDGMEEGFHFLTCVKVPVHELAMMMSIALRFIPILTEELHKIMKAQMSRGADFEEGNLIERAGKLLPLLVPLFVSAIRRAGELAMAMDARCYHGGEGRTRFRPLEYENRDYLAYASEAGYLLLMLILCCVTKI